MNDLSICHNQDCDKLNSIAIENSNQILEPKLLKSNSTNYSFTREGVTKFTIIFKSEPVQTNRSKISLADLAIKCHVELLTPHHKIRPAYSTNFLTNSTAITYLLFLLPWGVHCHRDPYFCTPTPFFNAGPTRSVTSSFNSSARMLTSLPVLSFSLIQQVDLSK